MLKRQISIIWNSTGAFLTVQSLNMISGWNQIKGSRNKPVPTVSGTYSSAARMKVTAVDLLWNTLLDRLRDRANEDLRHVYLIFVRGKVRYPDVFGQYVSLRTSRACARRRFPRITSIPCHSEERSDEGTKAPSLHAEWQSYAPPRTQHASPSGGKWRAAPIGVLPSEHWRSSLYPPL